MKTLNFVALLGVTAILIVPSSPDVMAQESDVTDWNIQLGVGAVQASDLWTGAKNEIRPIPYLDVRKGNWHFNTKNLIGYRIQFNELWSVSAGVGARNDGYEDDYVQRSKLATSQVFDGYDEPDTEAVLNYGIAYGWLSLDATCCISYYLHPRRSP